MREEQKYESSLKGHFLIAMPNLPDPNFSKTVTILTEHTQEGAMGLVINRIHGDLILDDVFRELKLESISEVASLPLHVGGPVHTGQVFILHGPPFDWEACQPVNASLALSSSKDILEMAARGKGPQSVLVIVGCAGWGPGQLEAEVMANSWLTNPADTSILFDIPVEKRWEAAAKLMGIDPTRLANVAGHA